MVPVANADVRSIAGAQKSAAACSTFTECKRATLFVSIGAAILLVVSVYVYHQPNLPAVQLQGQQHRRSISPRQLGAAASEMIMLQNQLARLQDEIVSGYAHLAGKWAVA